MTARVGRDLVPIGSFASRCRLSVKALRHYDELGLLRPALVDVATGYRYYDRGQAPTAIAIALLRSLDVPLTTIRALLLSDDADAMVEILDRERQRRAREIARSEIALRSIERLMRAGTVFPYEITVREEPARTVLVVEGTTTAELHVATGTTLARTLLARLERSGRPRRGPIMCLLTPGPDETLVLRMCTAVDDPPPDEPALVIPAGEVAVARHVGPYEEIGLAEHALHAWAEERSYEPRGPIREIYLNDPEQVAGDALETDVVLPITRPSARTRGTAVARR
jgi:DNA-binding transcriptional MerR regulator